MNTEVTWTFYHDQDSFVRPKHFDLPFDHFLENVTDEYYVVVSDDIILDLNLYFIRNTATGMAFMLTWILELALNIWRTHKMMLSRKFAFRAVMLDYLDLLWGRPVHHRLRSQIGTIKQGVLTIHYYNWNDYSKFVMPEEFGLPTKWLSEANNITQPFYWIKSPVR